MLGIWQTNLQVPNFVRIFKFSKLYLIVIYHNIIALYCECGIFVLHTHTHTHTYIYIYI